MMRKSVMLAVLLLQSGGLPVASTVTPVRLFDLAGYSEGIVFDSSGNAYVSLLHRDVVLRIRPGAAPETWVKLDGPNGHKILPDGTHIIAAKYGVFHVDASGKVIDTLATRFNGKRLKGPNDLAVDGFGGFYFTDPADADADQAAHLGQVYYVDARRHLSLAATGLCYANGLIVRADGRVLYVDDSCTSRVYAFDIVGPGRLARRRTFAALPDSGTGALDGMTADANGNLFIAHYGVGRVEVLDATGHLVRRYATRDSLSSNVAFTGPNLDQLYVTGAVGAETGPGVLMKLSLVGVRGRSSRAQPSKWP